MIHSLFVINPSGDVLLEKHWKSVIPRSVCDYFFDEQSRASSPQDIPPVIATPHHYLISILRNKLFFLAVTMSEVSPLFIIEFLHRVVDTLMDYFNDCNESTLKEHVVVVYELLDEMLDNGFPLATELNILKELIKPPNLLRTITNTVTGRSNVSATLPTGQLSCVPWRRAGVKYTNNEAYFDVIEEVDAIIDKTGTIVSAEIQGRIDCCMKLSGMPDLTLNFMNPQIFDDVSFHPCVRFRRWEAEKVLSFVPPDGNFRLMTYHINSQNQVNIPINVRNQISFREPGGGRVDISVGAKTPMGKTIDEVTLEMTMPKGVLNVSLIASQGKYSFEPTSKLLTWNVGKIELGRQPNIRGSISVVSGAPPTESQPIISVHFSIQSLAVSGVKVNRLDMYGEYRGGNCLMEYESGILHKQIAPSPSYKPFKGVKYITKAGKFQVRT